MTQLPSPLTPHDCDLRDFPFMPLDVVRLRDSDLAALESPESCWAAVLLWCASWHQVPAASLPDDDRVLANLAGFGRVVKEWQKLREGALRGWVKCSDGRLYHPVVADKANEAWDGRLAYRQRKEADRLRKAEERAKKAAEEQSKKKRTGDGNPEDRGNLSGGQTKEIQRTGEGNPEEKPLTGTVERDRDSGEGQERGTVLKTGAAHTPEGSGQQTGERAAPPACVELAEELRKGGVAVTESHVNVIAWAGRGLTIPQAREALAIARQRKPTGPIPPNYLLGIIDDILNPPAPSASGTREPPWWLSEQATLAKGRELGIEANAGESMEMYRDRLHTAIKRKKDAE